MAGLSNGVKVPLTSPHLWGALTLIGRTLSTTLDEGNAHSLSPALYLILLYFP